MAHLPVLPSAIRNDVGTLVAIISQLNALPACAPVNASMVALRLATHDSGSGWFATPFLHDSFIHNSTPVYPGALRILLGFNRITRRERLPLFEIATKEWLASKGALSPLGRVYYEQYARKLVSEFNGRLVSSVTLNDIAALQQKRLAGGLSARTVNCEVATLRQILKHYGCWGAFAARVRFLRENTEIGKALSLEEEDRLLKVAAESPSAALYPLFVLSLDAGLRPSKSRSLRRTDITLRWVDGAIAEGEVIVPRSKTEGGSGRVVPLTSRARRALTL
jgi:integrase